MKRISFVIPVFRNEGSIRELQQQILSHMQEHHTGFDIQILFVDDGSDDSSREIIRKLTQESAHIGLIGFSENFGQVPAIIAGLKHCDGDATIVMSADLQDPVPLISDMVQKWMDGHLVVIGNRSDREDHWISQYTSAVFYRLVRFALPTIPPGGFDFFLLDQTARHSFNKIGGVNRFLQGDILNLGEPVCFIPYTRLKRKAGKSQWTLSKKMRYAFDAWMYVAKGQFNTRVLFPFLLALAGLFMSAVYLHNQINLKEAFEHNVSTTAIILFASWSMLMLLFLGVCYLFLLYQLRSKKPTYTITEMIQVNS